MDCRHGCLHRHSIPTASLCNRASLEFRSPLPFPPPSSFIRSLRQFPPNAILRWINNIVRRIIAYLLLHPPLYNENSRLEQGSVDHHSCNPWTLEVISRKAHVKRQNASLPLKCDIGNMTYSNPKTIEFLQYEPNLSPLLNIHNPYRYNCCLFHPWYNLHMVQGVETYGAEKSNRIKKTSWKYTSLIPNEDINPVGAE